MTRIEKIGNATLYLGDCLEIIPELKRADGVITDPPYAVPTIVAQTREITRNAGDLSIAETAYRVHADAWKNLLGNKGRAFVCCDGASYPSLYRAMYAKFNLALLIWNKNRIGMGREFRKSHELILHAWGRETPVFKDGVGRPDVIDCPSVSSKKRVHPAEKPIELVEKLLPVCGPMILDPFMGGGTTGLACMRNGFEFVGIEIEPDYFDIACCRMEALFLERETR